MKLLITDYTFDASAKTITFDDYVNISLEGVLVITNVTSNIIIYNFASVGKGGTVATNVLTLDYDTAAMSDSDLLQIHYYDATYTPSTTGLTNAELRASPVDVDGTFWQATQPVSGTITANAGTNLNTSSLATEATLSDIETALGGTLDVNIVSGGGGGGLTDTELRASPVEVDVTNATIAVTGTVSANAGTNLNTSALALESTLSSLNGKVTAVNTGAVVVSSSALPSGASTSALQTTGNSSLATIAGAVAGTEMQVDVLSMPSNIDVRDLVFASDKVDISGSTLAANSGVDIGDVTINNASGASAVNIQDGGNSITIDGSLTTISTVSTITNVVHVDDNAGTLSVDDGGGSISIDGNVGITGTVTVAGTDLDIRNLDSGTDSVSVVINDLIGAVLVSEDGNTVADILDLTNSNPLTVAIVDSNGDQIASFGGGTEYTEGDTDASITGSAVLMEVAANTLQPIQGSVADGLLVNLGSNNDVTVTGTIAATQSGTWNVTNISGTLSLPTGASTLAEQQTQTTHLATIAGDTTDIEAAVELLDDTVVTLGTTTYTEASSKGLVIGGVRRDADTTLVDTTNEFAPVQLDANGRLKVEAFSGETLPVSLASTTITGTVAVTQSGTWDEIGINDSGNSITVDDGGSTLTVDGTVATTQSGTWVLGANSGVDIGDVTINNGAAGAAVNIQDGGNTITVDGTVAFSNTTIAATNAGTFAVQPSPSTSGGLTTYHLVSGASTNAVNIKATPGQVYGWYIYNSNAAARKVAFHNTAGTPTAGASIFQTLVIPPSSGANLLGAMGIEFSTGIAITTVTGLADNDSAAVAANDLIINIYYK